MRKNISCEVYQGIDERLHEMRMEALRRQNRVNLIVWAVEISFFATFAFLVGIICSN